MQTQATSTTPKPAALNVLVVDDHQIVLFGIAALLSSCQEIAGVTKTTSAREAVALMGRCKFDIAIVDVELEEMSGIELLRQLRAARPSIAVIFHSMHEEMWIIRQMMEAKPDAIVLKGDSLAELKIAVQTVAEGGRYFSSRYERYCSELNRAEQLSEREIEILHYISDGLNTAQIAKRLYITPYTVEYHRGRILRKLGASNMAELIKKGVALGYLTPFGA